VPRAIWSGSVSFGLVNIPVKLYSAVSRKTVHFNQLDARTGARVKQKRVDSETGEEVPWDQIVKGYELASGAYVTVTDDEMASLDPKAVRTIEIEEFVDLSAIDPIFYDSAYYLAPDKSSKPYALLARAMEEQGKVALARFVMRTKQYLASVRAKEGMLLLSTMVYADEVVPPEQLPELDEIDRVKVNDKEVAMAAQLIDSLSADFAPERFRDTYRDQVLELIERKASGEEIVVETPEAPEATSVVDLMAALEASVKDARESRKRHPTAVASADDDEDDEDEGPKKAAKAKKATKKRAAPAKRAKKSA
jgi:DNA end-binding protein Ku